MEIPLIKLARSVREVRRHSLGNCATNFARDPLIYFGRPGRRNVFIYGRCGSKLQQSVYLAAVR